MRTEDVIDITYEKLTNNQIPLLYLDPDFVVFFGIIAATSPLYIQF